MPAASILIKPSSANCNIDCKYCFYKCLCNNREEYSRGFMSEETLKELIVSAIDYADGYLAFAFQGGEPTLAGVDFFKKAVHLQKEYNYKNLIIENTIQTNGILIDESWAEFLGSNDFLVGLSLDGNKKMHDMYRQDTGGNGTFEKVMNTISLFNKYNVKFNILSVITAQSSVKASALYKFYNRNKFDYIQLIPCMDEADRGNIYEAEHKIMHSEYAVTPKEYGKFLCEIFDMWYEDFVNGSRMDIRMFSNLAQMAAGYPAEECGMNGKCNCYFVVEGDGSVYPCDFYCTDEWQLGNVSDGFNVLADSDKAKDFVNISLHISEKCSDCKYFSLCRGGCRRWREPFVEGKAGLNYLCGAYEIFFEHTWDRIKILGDYINRVYSK